MSDPYLLRDEKGYPLTSMFHQVPKQENQFILYKLQECPPGKGFGDLLKKLFDNLFPPLEIHDTELEEDEGK